MVSRKNSLMSTHLWFVHLLNWHFSLHLPPLQRPGICGVDNFQRFRFGSHQTSLQERVKQESTFTFTFTLRTIYDISKGVDLPQTMKCKRKVDSCFTLSCELVGRLPNLKRRKLSTPHMPGRWRGGRWTEKCQLGRCMNQRWVEISEFFPDTTVFYD